MGMALPMQAVDSWQSVHSRVPAGPLDWRAMLLLRAMLGERTGLVC